MKQNSKRSKLLLLLLLFLPIPFHAEDLILDVLGYEPLSLFYSFDIAAEDRDDILRFLNLGSSSELSIEVNLFKRDKKSLIDLTDDIIYNDILVIKASYDQFSQSYRITDSDGKVYFFSHRDDFLVRFLTGNLELTTESNLLEDLSTYYIRFKAILIKRVYVEPFRFFQIINYKNRISTEWREKSLIRETDVF